MMSFTTVYLWQVHHFSLIQYFAFANFFRVFGDQKHCFSLMKIFFVAVIIPFSFEISFYLEFPVWTPSTLNSDILYCSFPFPILGLFPFTFKQHITTYHHILPFITTYQHIASPLITYHHRPQHITSYHQMSPHVITYNLTYQW